MNTKELAEKIVYSIDAGNFVIRPKKIFLASDLAELRKAIEFAKKHNLKITPRASGTNLVGDAVGELIVDVSGMNKIIKIEKNYVVVEPGVIVDDLNYELSKKGLFFPVVPSSSSIATIGGMIACNSAGHKSIRFGKMEDNVISLKIMNSRGEIVEGGADFCGSEGCAGFVVEAKLKILPKEKYALKVFSFDNVDEMVKKINELKKNKDIASIEYISPLAISLAKKKIDNKHLLLAEFVSEKKRYSSIWNLRLNLYSTLASKGYALIEDPVVFDVRKALKLLEGMKVPVFGHIGVGILHPCFENHDQIEEFFSKVDNVKITGEHGFGRVKENYYTNEFKKKISLLKKKFDLDDVFQSLFLSDKNGE